MTHRALVVGAGNAGKAHAEALQSIGIDVVGPLSGTATVADLAPLRDPTVDVVHVTTANDLHPPLVREALRAGKHVVCEKPLAGDLEGAEKLAEWAQLSGRHTTICQNYRFLPLIAELASRVAGPDSSFRWTRQAPASLRFVARPRFCRSCLDTSRVTGKRSSRGGTHMRGMSTRVFALAAAAAILVTACSTTGPSAGGGATDQGKPFVFASTQFTPVLEQENMRKKILTAYQGANVDFVTDQGPIIIDRISAESKAGGQGQIGVVGAENGELAALAAAGVFEDLSKVADKHKDKKIPQDMVNLGRYGGSAQVYVPWMQATFFLVANKKALPYLPSGADVNALTYKQLIEWAKNISEKTGQRRFGFPLGGGATPGLIHRQIQGYFYPSYTGGLVTTFKSADAVTMWNDLKELWKYSHPQSTSYTHLQEPFQSEEVWVGIDHAARLINVLKARPDDFVAVPAPAGPKGRYYMSVVIGLAIPKTTPNRSGAEALIDYMLRPETQLITLRENSFFPVVDVKLPENMDKGLKLEADAVAKQASAKDAKVVPLPVGLGAKGNDFNKALTDTFVRIAIRGEPIETVLNEQGALVQKAITEANAKCWGPDGTSSGPCQVK